jgi:nitronate monooxygenase
VKGKNFWVTKGDLLRAREWARSGFDSALMRTPDNTLVFVDSRTAVIRKDQADCMGCLSQCAFSSWMDQTNSTGRLADPRSFCIQKTLQDIAHGGDDRIRT